MSNCNAGELAVVVRPCEPWGDTNCYRGAIVKVKTPLFTFGGALVWIVEDAVRCPRGRTCVRNEFPDACLQPLRGDEGEHPGDVKVSKIDEAIREAFGAN